MRFRRNPRPVGLVGMVTDSLMPSFTAAGSALALDLVFGFLPLPAMLKTGPVRHVTRAVGAVALGALAGMVARPETARLVTSGAMTVVAYGALRELAARFMPQLPLGLAEADLGADGLGYEGSGYPVGDDGVGAYLTDQSDAGMGMYLSADEAVEAYE